MFAGELFSELFSKLNSENINNDESKDDERHDILPVGTKYGCLTTIDDGQESIDCYDKTEIINKIKEKINVDDTFIKDKISDIDYAIEINSMLNKCADMMKHFKTQNVYDNLRHVEIDIVDNEHIHNIDDLKQLKKDLETKDGVNKYIDLAIQNNDKLLDKANMHRRYKCICTCGNELRLTEEQLFNRKRRYCEKLCENRNKEIATKIQYIDKGNDSVEPVSKEYTKDRIGRFYATLKIDSYTEITKKYKGVEYKSKLYKCKCHLCRKEYEFTDEDFNVKDLDSKAKCNCYAHSKFQWRLLEILEENNVYYLAEYKVEKEEKYSLRFDFAIYDKDTNNITHFIECNGEQHYRPCEKFGGMSAYIKQKENDEIKRKWAKDNGVELIEIPYTCDENEIINFLISFGIIKDNRQGIRG